MSRFYSFILVASFVVAADAGAQQTVPPAAPTIGASGGVGGGIVVPLGSLNNTHSAGYTLSGLVDFSAAEQPYSFRAELIYQHFDRKSTAPVGTRSMNITSIGASVLARSANKGLSSTFVIGGIGVYKLTDGGTKPGVNAGVGLEVPLTFFIGMADVRLHYILTEGRPAMSIPITLGARF